MYLQILVANILGHYNKICLKWNTKICYTLKKNTQKASIYKINI